MYCDSLKRQSWAQVSETDGQVDHRMNEHSNYGSPIMPDHRWHFVELLWHFRSEVTECLVYATDKVICKMTGEINSAKTEITKYSETAQLWVAHWRMIDLVRQIVCTALGNCTYMLCMIICLCLHLQDIIVSWSQSVSPENVLFGIHPGMCLCKVQEWLSLHQKRW